MAGLEGKLRLGGWTTVISSSFECASTRIDAIGYFLLFLISASFYWIQFSVRMPLFVGLRDVTRIIVRCWYGDESLSKSWLTVIAERPRSYLLQFKDEMLRDISYAMADWIAQPITVN